MKTKPKIPKVVWAIPLLMPLLMGQSSSSCASNPTDKRPRIELSHSADLIYTDTNTARTQRIPDIAGNEIDQICVGHDKIICEWGVHPSDVDRALDQYGPTASGRPEIDDAPLLAENFARCGTGETFVGVCEDWHDALGPYSASIGAEAITMFDRGQCSVSLPTQVLVDKILTLFKTQAAERLGDDQRHPEGKDVALWTDFVYGMKEGNEPFRAWTDWKVLEHPILGDKKFSTIGEVIVEGSYKVDGNLEWRFDLDRYGDSTAGAFLAGSLQTLWYANPLTFWTVFLGNCEKDRPMRVRFRGEFQATEDGGVGIKINDSDTCGPNRDGPCTWAHIYPWPARPVCNNRIKPDMEKQFVSGILAGMVNPETGKPRCLTCREDGTSELPFYLKNGDPIPIRRVVMGPTETTFVFIDDVGDPEQNEHYYELYDRNLCNFDRPDANTDYTVLTRGGTTL